MVLSRLAKLLLLYQVNILYCTYYVTLLIVYIAIGFNVETVEVAMDAPLDSSNEPSLIVQKYQIPSVGPRWAVKYPVRTSPLFYSFSYLSSTKPSALIGGATFPILQP